MMGTWHRVETYEPRVYLREATLRAVRNPGMVTLARDLKSQKPEPNPTRSSGRSPSYPTRARGEGSDTRRYVGLAAIGLGAFLVLPRRLPWVSLLLMALGALVYVAGAFADHRDVGRLVPGWFGPHEIRRSRDVPSPVPPDEEG